MKEGTLSGPTNEMSLCVECGSKFIVREEEREFLNKLVPDFVSDVGEIPDPSLCPYCRQIRRLSYRPWLFLTRVKCAATGEMVVSQYPETVPFPVYGNEAWKSDSWDALDYGREFQPEPAMFGQLEELRNRVPHRAVTLDMSESSGFCNTGYGLKNCYLCFNCLGAEGCLYCDGPTKSVDCIDCSYLSECELCYQCVNCQHCYNLQSSESCSQCRDSYFLLNCRSCESCIGCVNLSHKKFHIFNERCSKVAFDAFVRERRLHEYSARKEFEQECWKFFAQHPHPHMISRLAEDATGNYIFESGAIVDSFYINKAERLSHCYGLTGPASDCMDVCGAGAGCQWTYECCVVGLNSYNLQFCFDCWDGNRDLFYCMMCLGCSNCFGCVGLKRKSCCILNKQYTKSEYEVLVPKIIQAMKARGEWGEFFPTSLSPIHYNISLASIYQPLQRAAAADKGYQWYDLPIPSSEGIISWEELGEELPADDKSLIVESTYDHRPFKITAEELKRYRKLNVPLPRYDYVRRLSKLRRRVGGLRLHHTVCGESKETVLTAYPEDFGLPIWSKSAWEQRSV